MKIPKDAVISDDKIIHYLLVLKARNDKSKFLAQAGFTPENPGSLKAAIQTLIQTNEAIADKSNEYGTFYQVTGELPGVNGNPLSVVTIWLRRSRDQVFQFITLKPYKEQ